MNALDIIALSGIGIMATFNTLGWMTVVRKEAPKNRPRQHGVFVFTAVCYIFALAAIISN